MDEEQHLTVHGELKKRERMRRYLHGPMADEIVETAISGGGPGSGSAKEKKRVKPTIRCGRKYLRRGAPTAKQQMIELMQWEDVDDTRRNGTCFWGMESIATSNGGMKSIATSNGGVKKKAIRR